MAVAFNAATVAAGIGSSLTLAHTAVGQNRLLMFAFAVVNTLGSGLLDAPTCAGVPMVLVNVQTAGLSEVEVWRAVAPPAGSAAVFAAWDSSVNYVAAACSYVGVHQTVPLGTPQVATGSGAEVSVTLPGTLAGSMVFDAVGVNLTNTTATAVAHGGQSEHQNSFAGASPARVRLCASDEGGGGSANMAWTLSQARLWAQIAVELMAAPASGSVRGRTGGLAGLKRLGRSGRQG